MKISKNHIRYDAEDWLAGAAQQYAYSIGDYPQMIGDGATVQRAINPFRGLGFLSPGAEPTSATNVSEVSAQLMNVAYNQESSTDYAYMIEAGTDLHRMQISNFTISNTGSWPHTISGSGTETGDDCISYEMNISSTRTQCVFYSWNDSGGAWNIGLFNTSAGTFDDDWFTTVPASAFSTSGNAKRHPMIIGADDVLYVGDGNILHGIDGAVGANGTVYEAILTLPASYQIASFAKTPDFLVIFAYQHFAGDILLTSPSSSTRNATAFFYDYLSLDPTYVIPLDDDYVSCGITYKSTVACFTGGAEAVPELSGADRYSRLKIWDGAQFTTVKQFLGNPPLHGGAAVAGSSIQWLTTQGNVLCYGSPYEDVNAGLNVIADVTGISLGLYDITSGGTGYPIVSSGSSTSGGLERIRTDFADNALLVTGAATPILSTGQVADIEAVTIYFGSETDDERAISIALITENGTVTNLVSNLTQITSSNKVLKITRDVNGDPLPKCQEVRLSFSWGAGNGQDDAPQIRYVDIEYNAVNFYN